jgi:hypothetical protein
MDMDMRGKSRQSRAPLTQKKFTRAVIGIELFRKTSSNKTNVKRVTRRDEHERDQLDRLHVVVASTRPVWLDNAVDFCAAAHLELGAPGVVQGTRDRRRGPRVW